MQRPDATPSPDATARGLRRGGGICTLRLRGFRKRGHHTVWVADSELYCDGCGRFPNNAGDGEYQLRVSSRLNFPFHVEQLIDGETLIFAIFDGEKCVGSQAFYSATDSELR